MTEARIRRQGGALRPVRRRNLSHVVAEALAAEIVQGRLRPGERLRSERDLSEAFAVGRSSVREAIKALESRGLVEGRHGEGTFVRGQGLDTLVQVPTGPVAVTEAEVRHLFEVRELLEPGIARLAADRARPVDVAALRGLLQRQERLFEARRYASDEDRRFHVRVARISGNPVLIRLLDGVMRMLGEVRDPALHAAAYSGRRTTLDGHWNLVRAIEARDPHAAAEAVLHHLAASRDSEIAVIRGLRES